MANLLSTRALGAAALLVLAASSAACITETVSSTEHASAMRTEGVVVFAPLEQSWTVVQDVINSMCTVPPQSAGVPHSLQAIIGGASTNVLVEFKNTHETAIHVRSDSPRVAERIRSAVQFRLARR